MTATITSTSPTLADVESTGLESLSSLTVPFTEKGRKAEKDMYVVTISSKTTKGEDGKKVPAPFQPFTVVLPSSYLLPLESLPPAFRTAVLDVLEGVIKALATSRKLAGNESVILARDVGAELAKAQVKLRLSAATVGPWYDANLAPLIQAQYSDEAKGIKAAAQYRAAFLKSLSGTLSQADVEKLIGKLALVETESDPLLDKLTAHLEAMASVEEMLLD